MSELPRQVLEKMKAERLAPDEVDPAPHKPKKKNRPNTKPRTLNPTRQITYGALIEASGRAGCAEQVP